MDSVLISLANKIATNLHADQHYGDMPYIEHCIMVAATSAKLLINHPVYFTKDDEVFVAIVGFLHDTIEDSLPCESTAFDMYSAIFNVEVAKSIAKLTKPEYGTYSSYLRNIASINIEDKTSVLTLIVKMADSLVNLHMSKINGRQYSKYERNIHILKQSWDNCFPDNPMNMYDDQVIDLINHLLSNYDMQNTGVKL